MRLKILIAALILSLVLAYENFRSSTPEMLKVHAGSFMMGSTLRGDDEKPRHKVTIDYDFYMGKYEVTFAEYDKYCKAVKKEKPDDEGLGRGDRPVGNVDWHEAKAYAAWLSQTTGEKYRLPTEAEWEYVAKAGTITKYYFGKKEYDGLKDHAWYRANSGGQAHEVGGKAPNPWGFYDMYGNVWEWCEDGKASYAVTPRDGSAYIDKEDTKIMRGGSWFGSSDYIYSSRRYTQTTDADSLDIGFRLVKE